MNRGNKKITRKKVMRISAVLLVFTLVFSLSACGAGPSRSAPAPAPSAPSAPSEAYAPSEDPADYDGGYPAYDGGYPDYAPYYDYSGGERYTEIDEKGVRYTDRHPESTFSLKVDTAAYSNVKRYIENGMLPPADAVRIEELINWFNYDEPLEFDRNSPFAFYTEVGPSPFSEDKHLALIRVGTREIDKKDLPPSNLVFLIDVSGSMSSYDKLPLLQEAFSMLTETLDRDDVVSIVTYASGTNVALSGARGSDSGKINRTIFSLTAGGSTAGAGGIQLAYELAEEYFIEGGNNRVILATDGDFNVGISNTKDLSRFISKKRDTGVYLSVLGFGTGNIRDDIMETLAKDGNGNYSYIDDLKTAEKVLVDELGSNLYTVADDVKAQIVFDSDTVYSYTLIGYENRMLKKEDFDNDKKDAGEIGAGSDIIALYEIELMDNDRALSDRTHLFDVRIRYKDPGDSESQLIEFNVKGDRLLRRNTTDFGFVSAVAMYGSFLRDSGYGGRTEIRAIMDLAEDNIGMDRGGYREDFVDMLYYSRDMW
jgi:Ca-activated chloride channel family protein